MNGMALENISDNSVLEPVERSQEELRQELQDKKKAMAETLNRLDQRVQRAFDWRAQVGDHPLMALGIAVGAGCLVSGIFKRKPSPGERMLDAVAEGVEDLTGQVRDQLAPHLSRLTRGSTLKATAATLAVEVATAYLNNKLSTAPERRNAELNR